MTQLKNSLRFAIPLLIILSIIAYSSLPLIQFLTSRWFDRDAEIRSQFVLSALEQSLAESAFDNLKSGQKKELKHFSALLMAKEFLPLQFAKRAKYRNQRIFFQKILNALTLKNWKVTPLMRSQRLLELSTPR